MKFVGPNGELASVKHWMRVKSPRTHGSRVNLSSWTTRHGSYAKRTGSQICHLRRFATCFHLRYQSNLRSCHSLSRKLAIYCFQKQMTLTTVKRGLPTPAIGSNLNLAADHLSVANDNGFFAGKPASSGKLDHLSPLHRVAEPEDEDKELKSTAEHDEVRE